MQPVYHHHYHQTNYRLLTIYTHAYSIVILYNSHLISCFKFAADLVKIILDLTIYSRDGYAPHTNPVSVFDVSSIG